MMDNENAGGEGPMTLDEAVSMSSFDAPKEEEAEIAEGAAPETVEHPEAEELAEDANAAPEETSGETEDQEGEDPQDDSETIDAPRSWTKADKEIFKALPRESQQRLLEIDRARELEVRRGQNEVAEIRKAALAEAQNLESARQRYEAALPDLLSQYTDQFNAQFQDIKTWDDAAKLQQSDPIRFQEWQLAREKGEALRRQTVEAQERQQHEWQASLTNYIASEQQKFTELAPEFADPEKAPQLQAQARALLEDVGFAQGEIQAALQGQSSISPHDHRFQLIVRDAMRYRSAKQAVKTAPVKTVPPVQRPGVAPQKGADQRNRQAEAMKRLSKSGSINDALAIDF
jgi:hypothetical protein